MKFFPLLPVSLPARHPKKLDLRFLLALGLLVPMPLLAQTPVPTTTTLAISPGDSVPPGTRVTLKASVFSAGNPVSPGLVLFCDASAPYCTDVKVFGQAQLTSSGVATLNLILPIGVHRIKAVFQGTSLDAGSASARQALTVTTQRYPTATTISASGTPGNYSLTGTVTSIHPGLAGTLQFSDATNGDTSLGEAPLGPEALNFSVPPPPINASGYSLMAIADFNGDGKPDQAVYSNGEISTLLGNGDGTFTAKPAFIFPQAPYFTVVGDFNGDDVPDLLVIFDQPDVNPGIGTFAGFNPSILLGNGTVRLPPDQPSSWLAVSSRVSGISMEMGLSTCLWGGSMHTMGSAKSPRM
jgi:hypothetical protein